MCYATIATMCTYYEREGDTYTRHMEKAHPVEFGITPTQTLLNFWPGAGSGTGSSQTSGLCSSSLLKYDHQNGLNVVSRFAVMKHFPLNAFDNYEFELSMRQVYNNSAKQLSRTSVTRAVVRQSLEKKVQ